MVRNLLAGAFCALAVVVNPAVAEETAVSQPAPTAAATVPLPGGPAGAHPDDMVCKNQIVVGSHFKKRVCLKRREWAERAAVERKWLEDTQNAASGSPPAGMGGQ